MKFLILTALSLLLTNSFANTDLELKGEKWEAKHSGYICKAFEAESKAPESHDKFQVKFEVLRTDSTLDNGLVLATFVEDNATCRYSAILLADNDASTIKLIKSKAYAVNADSKCLAGKEMLDANLASNDYLYWGHPHHATIMIPVKNADVTCGADATHVGLDFTVSRRITSK